MDGMDGGCAGYMYYILWMYVWDGMGTEGDGIVWDYWG